MCLSCKHLDRDNDEAFTCRAFPAGIPTPIVEGYDHRKPFPGDGGIRFERATVDAAPETT